MNHDKKECELPPIAKHVNSRGVCTTKISAAAEYLMLTVPKAFMRDARSQSPNVRARLESICNEKSTRRGMLTVSINKIAD